ncbi:MAG: hypothetical protein EAZ57_08185 [Cytophagales bacterium]|nr:MAG: hypothetical protein EAZ67_09260 [Cytophagales bacterium]TAF60311.1 MAG: hypothetical protein EAZ57_08185 [Cytophagales bacterium]
MALFLRFRLAKQTFLLISALLCAISAELHAQSGGRNEAGAAAQGMGNAAVTVGDAQAMFNNIGALCEVEKTTAWASYENRFSMLNLPTFSAGFVMPNSRNGAVGVGVWRFGDGVYNEHRLALGYSHKVQGVSLGFQANYLQIMGQGTGQRSALVLEFGGVAQLSNKLFLGMHIYNLNQAKVQTFLDERLPTVMKAGLSYRPTNKLTINAETEKDTDNPAYLKAGLAYDMLSEKITLRMGLRSQPFSSFWGLSLRHRKLVIDYAFGYYDQPLGTSHGITLAYVIHKKSMSGSAKVTD